MKMWKLDTELLAIGVYVVAAIVLVTMMVTTIMTWPI
jgi:hypothetical protein